MAALLKSKNQRVYEKYPEKFDKICKLMEQIHAYEKEESKEIDQVSGVFGELMAEIFVYRKDEWEETLKRMGFFFGKFIYLMDAYEDVPQNVQKHMKDFRLWKTQKFCGTFYTPVYGVEMIR